MRQTAAAIGDMVGGATDAVRGTAQDMRDQTSAATDQSSEHASVARMTQRGTRGMADTASSMGGAIADTADRTRRQAADAVRQGRDSAASFVTEQPLLARRSGSQSAPRWRASCPRPKRKTN